MSEKLPIIGGILLVLAIIGGFIFAYSKSEIKLENGTVTARYYVPSRHDSHLRSYRDSNGDTHWRTESEYHPEEFNVSITGGYHTFNMNNRHIFNRFREGERVKVLYRTIFLTVQHVYKEDEQIPVEVQ